MKFVKNRASHYLFTVTNTFHGQEFFAKLRQVPHSGFTFQRWGRNRDRKGNGLSRAHGHVRMEDADRFDVYIRLDYYKCDCTWEGYSRKQTEKAREFLRAAKDVIQHYRSVIEYGNDVHKNILTTYDVPSRPIAEAAKFKEVVTKIAEKAAENYSNALNTLSKTPSRLDQVVPARNKWNVSLTINGMAVPGSTRADVETFVKGILPNATVISATMVDEHLDLPLVKFDYATNFGGSVTKTMYLRISGKDRSYVVGFNSETGNPEYISRDLIKTPIELISLPIKA